MLSTAYANAMTEALWYFKGIREEDVKKIPAKVMNYLKENSNKEYVCNFDYNKPVSEMHLMEETKVLITSICYSYWCEDDIEKNILREILAQNEKEYEVWQREVFNPDNVFNKEQKPVAKDQQLIVKPKENWFSRMLDKIRNLFRKGNR